MSWFLPFFKLHILLVSARPLYFVLGFFLLYIIYCCNAQNRTTLTYIK